MLLSNNFVNLIKFLLFNRCFIAIQCNNLNYEQSDLKCLKFFEFYKVNLLRLRKMHLITRCFEKMQIFL